MYTQGIEVLDRVARQRAMDTARLLAPASEYGVLSGSRDSLDSLLQGAIATPGLSYLAILDEKCSILAQSGRAVRLQSQNVCSTQNLLVLEDDTELLSAANPVRSQPLRFELSPDDVQRGYDAAARVVGWVYVEFDTTARETKKREVLGQSLALALLGLLLAGLIAAALARALSQPIRRMAGAVRQMREGNLSARIHDQAFSSELAALEDGFNAMAESIASNHEKLQARVDEATQQLSWQAHHDPLTGLANRRRFEQAIDELMAYGLRSGDHAALCFIDLDHFKRVNDSCGHSAGDALLKDVANIISGQVREDDLVCRMGGDEFAVILRKCPMDHARVVAESIRAAVAEYRLSCDGKVFAVGTSIGLVPLIGGGYSMLEITQAADTACYSAKKSGRNRVVEVTLEDGVRQAAHEPQQNLATVLREQRLELHAQNIFALDAPTIPVFREVFLRYLDQDLHPQSPQHILAVIDREDAALDLDTWVANMACVQLARELAAPGVQLNTLPKLFLNLSRASLQHGEVYLDRLDAACREQRVPAALLGLELSMTLVEQVPAEARRFAQMARQRGYLIVLEHFDSGSITRIGSIQPDFLKAMVASICSNQVIDEGLKVMKAMITMAHALGIKVIIAGVETPQQRAKLAEVGADFMQGDALAQVTSLDVPMENPVHLSPAE
jgi:diguanylate cyclase (GGDEF)-like protein